MEHQLAIFPVVSHRPQPGQSFRFCLVEYYRLFSKCSEIKFSGLHYRDFPKSKLGYVTFNFFLERDDSGKNFNQCNTKMVPNISCIHKNSFSRRRFGRSISDQHFSAQLHIALQKTHICTHTHTHTHTFTHTHTYRHPYMIFHHIYEDFQDITLHGGAMSGLHS